MAEFLAAGEGPSIRLAEHLGIPVDDPHFATNADRLRHRDELNKLIESALADRGVADVAENLAPLGIPVGRVRSLDGVYTRDQTRPRGCFWGARTPRRHRVAGPALQVR